MCATRLLYICLCAGEPRRIAEPMTRQLSIAVFLCVVSQSCGFDSDDGFGFTCQPHFDDGQGCEIECDASDVVIADGNWYCTTTCGVNNECPSGHVCARFDEGYDPESICLPPCQSGGDCPPGFLGCGDEGVCGL